MSSGLRKPEKIEVHLTGISLNALDRTEAMTSYTRTEVINRAIQVYNYLEEIWQTDGTVMIQRTPRAEIERLRMH